MSFIMFAFSISLAFSCKVKYQIRLEIRVLTLTLYIFQCSKTFVPLYLPAEFSAKGWDNVLPGRAELRGRHVQQRELRAGIWGVSGSARGTGATEGLGKIPSSAGQQKWATDTYTQIYWLHLTLSQYDYLKGISAPQKAEDNSYLATCNLSNACKIA